MGKVYDFTLTVGADDSAANQVLALLEKNLAKATKKENVISITADATNVEKALKELVELNPTVGANIELKVDQSEINKEIDFLNGILNSKTNLDADKIVSKFKSAFTSGIKNAKLGEILSDEVGDSSKSIANVQKAVDSIVSRITNVDISESMDMSEMTSYVKDLETASALINEISKNKKLTKVDLSALTSVVDSNKLKSAYSQIGQNVFMNSEQLLENLQQKSLSVVSDFQKRLGDILRYGAGYEIVSSDELDKEKAKLAEMEQALARTSQSADQLEDRMIAVADSIEKYEDAGDDSKVRALQQELLQLAEIYKSNEGIDLFDDEALDDESLDYLKTAIYAVLDAKDELKDFHFQLVSEEDVERQRALVSDLQNNITSVQKEVDNTPLVDEQSTVRIKELETEVENLREDLASAQLEARQLGEDLSTAQAELYEATYNQRTVEDFDNADKVKELEKQVDYLSEKLREAQGTINEFANELTTAERKLESALEQQKIDISIEPTVEPEEFAAKLTGQLTVPAQIEVEGKVSDPQKFAWDVAGSIDYIPLDVTFNPISDDSYQELKKELDLVVPSLALEIPVELSAKETAEQTQLAVDAIEAEGEAAKNAAKYKEGFAKANEKVAKASTATSKSTQEAKKGIDAEGKAAAERERNLQTEQKYRYAIKADEEKRITKAESEREKNLQYEQKTQRAIDDAESKRIAKAETEREKNLQAEQKIQRAVDDAIEKRAAKEESEREKNLQYEQKTQKAIDDALAKRTAKEEADREKNLQAEQKIQRAIDEAESKRIASNEAGREKVLQYEQKVRKAISEQFNKDWDDAIKENEKFDANANSQSSANIVEQNKRAAKAYKDLTKQAKTYYKLLDKEAAGTLTVTENTVLEGLKKEWSDAAEGVGKYSIALADTTDSFKAATVAASNFMNVSNDSAMKTSAKLSEYSEKLKALKADPSRYAGVNIDEVDKLLDRINEINNKPLKLNSEEVRNDIAKLNKDVNEFFDNLDKAAKDISIGNIKNEISDYLNKNTKLSMKFRVELYKLSQELESGLSDDRLKEIYQRFTDIRIEARELRQEGARSLDTISQRLGDMDSKFIAQLLSWQDIIRYIRTVAETVRDLDSALTEMRKVSNESVESLRAYQDISFGLADEIGATGLQIQNSTADFMRLGESLEEAQKSASTANILMNVSEFEDISEATDSLIAMSAAYSDLEKIDIVNKLNKIGNEYAVSTDGIATALQSSASALVTAHNDIDEAIALVTAGNLVTQDPNKVGTGLRTISLRLTGTKAAAAEMTEMGEEVDDMITTESKLRQTILDATKVASNNNQGFDILDENGNYKSTYQIMLGLSEIYDEIAEKDKQLGRNNLNLLLETIAGKNRANIAASILQNPDVLASAFDDSKLNSANSALEENQKFLESIEGHLQRLQNAVQDLFHSLIDSGLINDVLDFAIKFVEALDAIVEALGSKGSLVAAGGLILLLRNLGPITEAAIKNLPALIEGIQLLSGGAGTLGEVLGLLFPKLASFVGALGSVAPIILGIVAAIGAAVIAYDAFTVSVKESQEKIDEYNKSIETLTAELNELRDLENKTSYDNKRIEYLEKQLDIQKKLLEVEQQRYYLNLTEKSFGNAFDSDNIGVQQERDVDNYQNTNSTAYKIRSLEGHVDRLIEIQQEIDSLNEDLASASTEKEQKKILAKIEKLNTERQKIESGGGFDRYSQLLERYELYLGQEEQLVDALTAKTSSGQNMLTGKARDDAIAELEFARTKMKEITEAAREYEIAIGTFDPFNAITGIASENTFNEAELIKAIDGTDNLENAQKRLMAQFPSLTALCSKYGITLEELVAHYWEEKEAIEAVEEAEKKRENTLSNAVSNMNSRILPQFDALEKVYNEIFNGDTGFDLSQIGTDDLESIRSAFQDIDESLGIDWAGKTEDVDKFLSVIGNSSSTATEVHDAFDDLATSYFNAAVSAEDFTEENAKVLEQMLKEMGVINASDVVKSVRELRAIPEALSQLKLPDNFDEGIADAVENLENEFAKLEDPDWGISAGNIQKVKDGTIQSVFGNVDMDKRAIITWSEELKKEYKRELDSWEYDPEIGGIDTVFGGSGGFSLGNGQELTVAFTPIIETDKGAEMVAYDTLMDYIQTIVDQATEDGNWSLDEILALDQKGIEYDRYDEYGNKIGKQIVKGVIAGVGSEAIEIGSLMHFSGEEGAVELAKEEIEAYTSVKQKLEEGTLSLENVTAQEIAVLEKEGVVSVETANQIRLLALQKILNNENWINEANSISQVLALARAAGIAIPALTALAEVQAAISNAQMILSGEIAGNRVQALKDLQYYTWYGKELGARVANEVSTGVANIDYGPAKEDASSGGSETGDAYVEAFEKELKALEEQRDAGIITEKEFLDRYKALIEKYFKDVDGYGEEYAKRMGDYFQRAISYYESIFSAVGTLLDHRINAAQEGKDAAVDALEAEKQAALDNFDAQLSAIDELINAKQKEIDAIDDEIEKLQDEHDARKRNIDLQKAQYELQRAQQQRTRLIYKDGQMVEFAIYKLHYISQRARGRLRLR